MTVQTKRVWFLCVGFLVVLPCVGYAMPKAGSPPAGADTEFMFLINSDPQMGESDTSNKGLQVLNALLDSFVKETNQRTGAQRPAFVVWNGDLVWGHTPGAFANFKRLVAPLQVPSVLVHGNHDGRNNDPQFLDLQQALSGYRQLNYAFDYGQWRFVVIASQPKYKTPGLKKQLLDWLDRELKQHKGRPVMLFMHYHLLPVGLSQLEFYTYTPAAFRKQLLDVVTRYGNVKYVFSGHVHSGVKSSIKSSRTYRGTRFVVAPTPVFQRPFGEEYPEFSDPGRYDKRGFYLEVHVKGQEVTLVGRKINHPARKVYPDTFPAFDLHEDVRFFTPEGRLPANETLVNGGFDDGLRGWQASYRYRRDENPMFVNEVDKGVLVLRQVSGYGGWNFDEYHEVYQVVRWRPDAPNILTVRFKQGKPPALGGGGYMRVFAYKEDGRLGPMLLFHWGAREERANFVQQSWAYHATGDRRGPFWLEKSLRKNELLSYALPVTGDDYRQLRIDLNRVFSTLENGGGPIKQVTVAFGVWTHIMFSGTPIRSELAVDKVELHHQQDSLLPAPILLDNRSIPEAYKDIDTLPYGEGRYRNKRRTSQSQPQREAA